MYLCQHNTNEFLIVSLKYKVKIMKKVLLAAAMLLSLGASAQLSAQERGKIAVGGGLSYMTEQGQIGVGAKVRFRFRFRS